MSFFIPLLAGLVTGVLSGFGVGGGTLLLIYMTAFAGLPQDLAQGINLLYFLPAALTALPHLDKPPPHLGRDHPIRDDLSHFVVPVEAHGLVCDIRLCHKITP